jgi:hypothetical protein
MAVGGVGHPEAGSAHQDPPPRLALGDAAREVVRDRRVVRRLRRVGPEVEWLEAEPQQLLDEPLLQREPRMVGADRNGFRHAAI